MGKDYRNERNRSKNFGSKSFKNYKPTNKKKGKKVKGGSDQLPDVDQSDYLEG